MSYHLKYRPSTLDEVIGNESTLVSLRGVLKEKNPPHAFLFHGPTGCGKTTLARITAKELKCKGSDFREVDSADFRGIDTIRDIRRQSMYKPLESPSRVWLLDECHKLSNDAQSALLKGLEDTPKHVYYVLCTTDPHKLIPTIIGRCSQFQVSLLNDKQMMSLLRKVVRGEEKTLQRPVYTQIIQDSMGHPRNALQILFQVLQVSEEHQLKVSKQQAERQSQVIELCRALTDASPWSKVSKILSGLKNEDPETIRRQVLGYCQAVLLNKDNEAAGKVISEFIEPFYNSGWPGLTFACYCVIKV